MDPGVATGNPNEKIPVHIAASSQNRESERAPHRSPTGEKERQAQLASLPHLCERGFSPRRSSSLFFISLIGNLSTLCEIKAENQCLVSNNFQTNLFHLFSPLPHFFPLSPPNSSCRLPNANRGSRVMTSLSLLSCSNNALKNRAEKRREERDRAEETEMLPGFEGEERRDRKKIH